MLTNDNVSFEQLDPGLYQALKPYYLYMVQHGYTAAPLLHFENKVIAIT